MEEFCDNEMNDEVLTGHRPIPMNIAIKVMKSICKIIINKKGVKNYETGFFMKISDNFKYLITDYNSLNPNLSSQKIEIEIWNGKKILLDINNLSIKYFEKPKDIKVIEIKDIDDIYKDIEFLDYDRNYITKRYEIYKNLDIFSIQKPLEDDATCASGQIVDINGFEFDHTIPTERDSSGCPIIILNNNINLIQVLGVQKNIDNKKGINVGIFIGEIINQLIDDPSKKEIIKNELKENDKKINNNYIIGEIYITKDDIDKDIRILNEMELKLCEVKLDDVLIPFIYYHRFKKEGIYKLKYIFKNCLIKTNNLFSGCSSLSNLDLSNFNSQNVIDMSYMFYGCESLAYINFKNFNTQNVTNMIGMFCGCSFLRNLDLSTLILNLISVLIYPLKLIRKIL